MSSKNIDEEKFYPFEPNYVMAEDFRIEVGDGILAQIQQPYTIDASALSNEVRFTAVVSDVSDYSMFVKRNLCNIK